jgi:hypothetical protein
MNAISLSLFKYSNTSSKSVGVAYIGNQLITFSLANDERMHHYQRGRASITGIGLKLRRIIETGRLVGVVMTRLVSPLHSLVGCPHPLAEPDRVRIWQLDAPHLDKIMQHSFKFRPLQTWPSEYVEKRSRLRMGSVNLNPIVLISIVPHREKTRCLLA